MSFTEFQRDQIRTYLGFPRLYLSANPFLEQAITSIQTVAEGGSAPDASIENAVMVALVQINNLDGYINQVQGDGDSLSAYEIPTALTNGATLKQDYSRTLRVWRREGTNLIEKVAIRLGVQPLRPYFYSDGTQSSARSAYGSPSFFRGQSSGPRFFARR